MTRDERRGRRPIFAKAEEERLLAAMRESPGLSVAALAEAAHVGRSAADDGLRRLAARSAIERDAEGRWRLKRL
jgi:DNA-binding IclR family transcriptional regulator